jgi:alkanesulfonate monooxygenase SsuD/methylene tetrahydromethanopterin reductase-like flavin-dependent oxidoreductase (luciferase family)
MQLSGAVGAIPILIAAATDAALRLAGEVGDGALMAGPLDDVMQSMALVDEAATRAGRPRGSVSKIVWTTGSISDDPAIARDAVRPVVARKALSTLSAAARARTLPLEDLEALNRLSAEYDFRKHMGPEHSHLVLDRWLDRFALVGTPGMVLERCKALRTSGVDGVMIVVHGADRSAQIRNFAKALLPHLAS